MKARGQHPRECTRADIAQTKGAVIMVRNSVVICKTTEAGLFIPCPVCRAGKLMRLYPETTAAGVSLYCRRCKRETLVDIQPGERIDRVTLHCAALSA